eukprot:s1316_g6.t1
MSAPLHVGSFGRSRNAGVDDFYGCARLPCQAWLRGERSRGRETFIMYHTLLKVDEAGVPEKRRRRLSFCAQTPRAHPYWKSAKNFVGIKEGRSCNVLG